MKYVVKCQKTQLKSPLSTSATSVILRNLLDSKGNAVAMSDFGDWGTIVVKSGDTIEIIKFDGLTVNTDNSITLDVATNGRNIAPTSPYAGSAVGENFQSGAEVIVTNDPLAMSQFANVNVSNTFTTPQKQTVDPVDDEDLAPKSWILNNLPAGAVSRTKTVINGTAGENLIAGELVYLKSDGKWWKANATTVATIYNVKLGIAQGSGVTDGAITNGVLTRGLDTTQTGATIGLAYVSNTAGDISGSVGTYEKVVGVFISATALVFDPDFYFTITPTIQSLVPVGSISPYIVATPPSGWLNCDGGAISMTTYSALFDVLKTENFKYGIGTGTAFTVDDTTDIITSNSHGLTNGSRVFVRSAGTLPTGLTADTVYYVISQTTNTFQLSTTLGGSAINITSTGSGVHSWYTTFKLPDLKSRFPLGYSASAPTKVFTFASRSSNVITITGASNTNNNEIQTGQAVLYSAPSGAMTGLVHNTTYYLIRVAYNQFSLATSVADANAGTVIALSSDGTGAQTFTATYSARAMGDMGGEESHALTDAQAPSHTHTLYTSGVNSRTVTYITGNVDTAGDAPSSTTSPEAIDTQGSDEVHNNMPLFTTVNYIIKT